MHLSTVAAISVGLAVFLAVIIALDEIRRPQPMTVMNVVWPVTALYFSVFGAWAYFARGRAKVAAGSQGMAKDHHGPASKTGEAQPPTPWQVALGTSHCGAGCMLADVVTEFAVAGSGLILFGSRLWTSYLLDFIAAWLLGIVFQYFAIRPMRHELSAGEVVWAAVKADTLSILAFQVGMYLWMALVHFRLFPGPHGLTPFDIRYWLMMQIAMIFGFATSFPMNRWLIRKGLKEAM